MITVCYVLFPHIISIEGSKIIRKLIIYVTHHNPDGLVLTAVIELHECIVYILVEIIDYYTAIFTTYCV